MKEINPDDTSRAEAFRLWMNAPMPMVTLFKTLDVTNLTSQVAQSCTNHDITDSMVIGTSALVRYDIDGAVGMYSGIFNNPFMIWGRYRRHLWKRTLTVSFQFHHTQMDGAHAAKFLDRLQQEISSMEIALTK